VRRTVLLIVGGLVLSAAAATVWAVASGRTDPPSLERSDARRALERARVAEASRWAPGALARGEAAYRAAEVIERREAVRFFPLRNFAPAREAFVAAGAAARAAEEESSQARAEARGRAKDGIDETARMLDGLSVNGGRLHLASRDRRDLREAGIRLDAARRHFAASSYQEAAAHAAEASEMLRGVRDRVASKAARYVDSDLVARWQEDVRWTVAQSRKSGGPAIVVVKEEHRVDLWIGGRRARSYAADLGANGSAAKVVAGDRATPEGRYRIVRKLDVGQSKYHRALLLDYPNDEDRRRMARDKAAGRVPRNARLGGLIEIHGDGGRGSDWTLGCVALANPDMDDLFRRVPVGTLVTIVGGDGDGGVYSEWVRRDRESAR